MGFNKVYKSLKEIFPQIDARALRAVAIEHSKDADAAVDAVLQEIIPFFTEKSEPNTPSTGSAAVGESSRALAGSIATTETSYCTSVYSAAGSTDEQIENVSDANNGHSEPLHGMSDEHHEGEGVIAELTTFGSLAENNMQNNTGSSSHDECVQLTDKDGIHLIQNEVSVESETDKTTSDGKYPASGVELASVNDQCKPLETSKGNDAEIDENINILGEMADNICLQIESETAPNKDSDQGKSSVSQFGKIDMIDALAKIIADARDNKKMLYTAMDSVISLMREVELKEKAAEQAKVEASVGNTDILVKSEELKQMVKQAEEANFMHAGEVYGEKAILATELRELQSRALSLSVERDKYIAVLDEMQQTLAVRLAEAQNVIKSAEEAKIEKESAAIKAFAQQELIKEKVLEESKSLKQQAEDNAKLREFLVDRGQVVDMLQGEISVICEDVKLLKEKFDGHIPFSRSVSSSQTSFVLAASSSKSEQLESLNEEGADDPMDIEEKKGATFDSTEHSSQDEAARDDGKALSDDDWEIFDREYCS